MEAIDQEQNLRFASLEPALRKGTKESQGGHLDAPMRTDDLLEGLCVQRKQGGERDEEGEGGRSQ